MQPMPQELRSQRFVLPVKPTAKGRPRFANGHAWTPAKTRYAEEAIADLLKSDGAVLYPREMPLAVHIVCYVERPKSTARGITWPTKRPDLDQYVKLILDAGHDVLWLDDAQVCQVSAKKVYSTDPRTQLDIVILDDRDALGAYVSAYHPEWRGSHGHDQVG